MQTTLESHRGIIHDGCVGGVKLEVAWSTWRGCMPVAMPMLLGDKLGSVGVFVWLVQSSLLAVSGEMERTRQKLIKISVAS